ncbi:MAG: TlpA disulfide reductase family protein [Planctomycetota bacterium]
MMRCRAGRSMAAVWVGLAVMASGVVATPAWAQEKAEFPDSWFWGEPSQRAKHAELEGKPMPQLKLSDWRNGRLTKRATRGKILVVDFWATWCGPCIAAIPKNNRIAEEYADRGVIVLGVCGSRNGQERFDQVVEAEGIKYPVARDKTTESGEAWRVMWWPTYALVDREGIVRAVGLKTGHVEDAVKELLKEQPGEAVAEAQADTQNPEPISTADRSAEAAEPAAIPADLLEGSDEQRRRLAAIDTDGPPRLYLKNMVSRERLRKRDLEDKIVVLDFWATWCGPCIRSIPKNNELHETYKDDGVIVLGVCHPRGADEMVDVVRDHGMRYPTAEDVGGKTADFYRVNGYPDYYVFDRKGRLRAADVKNSRVEDVVKLLLAEDDEAEQVASRSPR